MAMTVAELISLLEECPQDAEVRLLTQPSWPFECSIGNVVDKTQADLEDGVDDTDEDGEPVMPEPEGVVYITEGEQLGYGSKRYFDR